MMDEEELDNDLSNRIREVFDNYEDTTADEGWALLRQKFPEKKKDRGLAWLWYAAAAVVLLCIGVWFIQKPNQEQNMVAHNPKPAVKQNEVIKQPTVKDTLSSQPANSVTQPTAPQLTVVPKPATPYYAPVPSAQTPLQVAGVVKPSQKTSVTQPPVVNPNTIIVNPPDVTVNSLAANHKTDSVLSTKNTAIIAATNKLADSVVSSNAAKYAANNPAPAEKPSSAMAMNKLLAETSAEKNISKKAGKARSTMFSVYAATYFNYAKGSDNSVNVGAGFTSDFKLSNNLKLSTGLSIAQNTLKYSAGTPAQTQQLVAAVAGPQKATIDQAFNSSPSFVKSDGSSVLSFSLATNLPPSLKNYNASLIGLDIPVNLKYLFNPQKSDTYFSAGLSSGTYINETYVLNYNYQRADQQSTTKASFNNFDLAKTLNVSFGVGYPLGKSNRLIVEPFLKYPLDGLGLQQIKFGAGGVNLKLNFQSGKK